LATEWSIYSFVATSHTKQDDPMENSPPNSHPADIETLRQELEQIFVRTKRADSKEAGPTKKEPAARASLTIKGK
jgi:hypothetical protein